MSSLCLSTCFATLCSTPWCTLRIDTDTLCVMVEAFTCVLGFHTFRVLIEHVIHRIYTATNIASPRWFRVFIIGLEIIDLGSVFVCYLLFAVTQDARWIRRFYLVLSGVIILGAVFVMMLLRRPLSILNEVRIGLDVDRRVSAAKLYLQMAIAACLVCCVGGVCDMLSVLFGGAESNIVMHSLILVMFAAALLLWIYRAKHCCVVPDDSVCMLWCCCLNLSAQDEHKLEAAKASKLRAQALTATYVLTIFLKRHPCTQLLTKYFDLMAPKIVSKSCIAILDAADGVMTPIDFF